MRFFYAFTLMAVISASCAKNNPEPQPAPASGTVIAIGLPQSQESKTYLDEPVGGVRKMYWSTGDMIGINGEISDPLPEIGEKVSAAEFSFKESLSYPYNILYPASMYKNANTITLPVLQVQNKKGTFAPNVSPAVGYAESESGSTVLSNVCSIVKLNLTAGTACSDKIKGVIFYGGNNEQVSGDFTVDYEKGTLTAVSSAAADKIVKVNVGMMTLSAEASDIYIIVPEGIYSKGFTVRVVDEKNHYMDLTKISSVTLSAGGIKSMQAVAFNPTGTLVDAELSDFGDTEMVYFSGGKGTAAEPYRIAQAQDLVDLSNFINNSETSSRFKSCYYSQTTDINMSSIANFQPIGLTSANNFRGHYDGGNHSIVGLTENNSETQPVGLFGNAGTNASFSNIRVVDVNLTNESYYTGGIVAYAYSATISNCYVSGTIVSNGNEPTANVAYAGGIAGRSSGSTFTDCTFAGSISSTSNHLGGIVGDASAKLRITNCKLEKKASVSCNYYCGGIIGAAIGADTEISGCTCAGNVHSSKWNAGGIISILYYGTVKSCVQSSCSTVESASYNVGGIAGSVNVDTQGGGTAAAYIDNCAVYGAVRGLYQVGGIAGLSFSKSTATSTEKVYISNCACIGAITATGKNNYNYALAGGILGYQQGACDQQVLNTFSRPYAVNAQDAASIGGIAALIGYDNNAAHKVINCYSGAADGDVQSAGSPASSSATCTWYGSVFGRASAAVVTTNCHSQQGLQFAPASSAQSASGCVAYSVPQMTDGTLLAKLNEGKSLITDVTPADWIAGSDGYPTFANLPADPYPATGQKKVSIIGDSISTFEGWMPTMSIEGKKCTKHYPNTNNCDVTTVDKTWWYRLIYNYMSNAKFEMNISSGNTTVVQNTTATSYSSQYWYNWDFGTRFIGFNGVGNPDIIFIHGGTNDLGHIASYGASEEMYPGIAMSSATGPTDAQLATLFTAADAATTWSAAQALDGVTFCSAYVRLLQMLKVKHPSAKIVCIIGDCVSAGMQASIKKMATHYGAKYVDFLVINGFKGTSPLTKYDTGHVHPDANGMEFMANTIYTQIGDWLEK